MSKNNEKEPSVEISRRINEHGKKEITIWGFGPKQHNQLIEETLILEEELEDCLA